LSEAFVRQLALAINVSGVEYQRAMFDRTALFRRVQSLFARADWLAMPTLTRTPPPIDGNIPEPFGKLRILCLRAARGLARGAAKPARTDGAAIAAAHCLARRSVESWPGTHGGRVDKGTDERRNDTGNPHVAK
jgi:hypothetical protein